ncbi:Pantothenate kinase 2 [Diplonema papillatum]|nr:Pantothenate kinase 2 [Diplonema papillatum]
MVLEAPAPAASNGASETAEALEYVLGLFPGLLGADIGGTVGKIVYLQRKGESGKEVRSKLRWGATGERQAHLEMDSEPLGGRVHFIKWATHRITPFCHQVKEEADRSNSPIPVASRTDSVVLYATGGGAYKFEQCLNNAFGVDYQKIGEFEALVEGFRFLVKYHPDTVYTMVKGMQIPVNLSYNEFFPAAICNIGSGVSILKIDSGDDSSYHRLGGTSIGGSTFLGFCRLMCGVKTYKEALDLARQGDARDVDICVADIYGDKAEELVGLPGDVAASSFGKLVALDDVSQVPKASIAASSLALVNQAIQQVAIGLAKRNGCKTVFFTGGFLSDNELSQQKLADFSALVGERALFLKHAEYAGALGCLWKSVHENASLNSTPVTMSDEDSI